MTNVDGQAQRQDRVPRDRERDYTDELAATRRAFVAEHTGVDAAPRRPLLVRPGHAAGQHRELHRRRPGPDRPGRPAAHRRRARPGRLLRPAGDDRGHAGRQLQPRHAPAHRERRRAHDRRRRVHAALARSSSSTTPSRPASSATGSTSTSTTIQARARVDDQRRQAHLHRPVLDRPAALPALQLHDRRRRRPEHDRQGDARRLRVDPEAIPGPPASTSSRATSTPTRSTRRSTCSPPAASASSPRPRSRRTC